ncbi:serine/threonine kinase [Ordospora colligata]|nr:serine/threonine kinase [Ordospora colligata]
MSLPKRLLNFKITGQIATGSYGDVFLAVDSITGTNVAIKIIRNTLTGINPDIESHIQSMLNHKNICRLYGCFSIKNASALVIELINGLDLHKFIRIYGRFDESHAKHLFIQMVQAVDYLHSHSIIHRDLKLENVIVADGTIKICDFGLSSFYSTESLLSDFCGTPQCAAPEIINGVPYIGPEVDIWCLGVILYAMVHGRLPFEDYGNKAINTHTLGSRLRIDESLSYNLKDLIKRAIQPNRSSRITMHQMLDHPWLGIKKKKYKRDIVFIDKGIVEKLFVIGIDKDHTYRALSNRESIETSMYCLLKQNPFAIDRKAMERNANCLGIIRIDTSYDSNSMQEQKMHRASIEKNKILYSMISPRRGCIPFIWSTRMHVVERDLNIPIDQSKILIEQVLQKYKETVITKHSKYTICHSAGLKISIELTQCTPFTKCSFQLIKGTKIEFVDFIIDFIRVTDHMFCSIM